jgi:hypothetical protein
LQEGPPQPRLGARPARSRGAPIDHRPRRAGGRAMPHQ